MYAEHHQLLSTRQEELLEELKALADQGFEQAKAEWDHNVERSELECVIRSGCHLCH